MQAESAEHAEVTAAEARTPRPGIGRGGARRVGVGRGGARRYGSAPRHRQPCSQPAASAAPPAYINTYPPSHCASIAKCPQRNLGEVDREWKVVSEAVGAVGVHSCRPTRDAETPITNRYAPLTVQCDLADDEGDMEAESSQHAEMAAAAARGLRPGTGRGGARRVGDVRGGVRRDGSAKSHRQPRSQPAVSPAPPADAAANRSSHSVSIAKWPLRDRGEMNRKGKADPSTTASSAGSGDSDGAVGIEGRGGVRRDVPSEANRKGNAEVSTTVSSAGSEGSKEAAGNAGRMWGAGEAPAVRGLPGDAGALCNGEAPGSGVAVLGHGAPVSEAGTGDDADALSEASSECNRDEIAELMSLLCRIMREPAAVREHLSGHVVQLENRLRRLGALSDDAC